MANRYIRAAGGNYNAAGTWELTPGGGETVAVPTASDAVIGTALSGQLTITATAVAQTVDLSAYVSTLTHNAFLWTISGNITFGAGMTYTPLSTATLRLNSTGTVITAGLLMPNFTHGGGASTVTIGDNFTTMDAKTIVLDHGGTGATGINLNGFTISGYSATSRLLIRSATLGTGRTITVASGTFANADFRDITFSSASDLDLSAITGLSGDCGGNTITGGGSTLTFTTGATQTATGSSANWSTATWSGRVPLPQDDVVLSLTAGQTLTNDMPRIGKNISVTTAMTLSINGTSQTLYGSLDLTNISGITTNSSTTLAFEGRNSFSYTPNGKTINGNFNCDQVGGTLTLMGAASFQNFTISASNFDANGYNVSASNTISAGTATWTKTVTLGSGTWNNSGANGVNTWRFGSTTGLTLVTTGSTVILSNVSSSAKTFEGGSRTYNNVSFTGGGTGAVTISGSNTFNTLTIGSPKTVTFTSGTTQTVSNFVATGTAGNLITLNAPTLTTTPPILSTTNGYMNCQYVNVQGVNVTPAGRWFSGNKTAHLGLNFGGQSSSGDYVSAANSASGNQIFGATSFSAEVWMVARTGGSSAGRMVGKTNTAATNGGYVFLIDTVLRPYFFITESAAADNSQSAVALSANALHHVVATWTSGAATKIYTDGAEVSSYTTQNSVTTPDDDSANSLILGNESGRTRTWDGQIYLVRLYRNVALSAANVTTLYNGGVMTKTSNPLGNATAEYLFHEGTGSTLTDSISAVNGTITGADWSNTGWRDGSSMDMFRSL